MFDNKTTIKSFDREVSQAIEAEETRQEQHIELIASENYASPRVLEAQGSKLTNKYAEGYPKKRYYGGCEYVDEVELLAIKRAQELFKASYVNVQPHSGSSANSAAFLATIKPHDTILGMSLAHGGHLTHGSKVNFSGKIYNSHFYTTDDNGYIDYNELEELARELKPKLIIAGFSAYSRIIDWSKFREVADMVGAYLLTDIAHVAGLVVTGHYPSPVEYADVITSTTHKTLRGPRSGIIVSNSSDEAMHKALNSGIFPGYQGGPLMHAVAAKAVAFQEALQPEFTSYQEQVVRNAKAMAAQFMEKGIDVVSGGTDNHLMLISLVNKGLTGKEVDAALGRANITVNKNAVPKDPQSPFVTSGIRVGTPAITTRGFKEAEARQIADWIIRVIENVKDEAVIEDVKQQVLDLTRQYPVYS